MIQIEMKNENEAKVLSDRIMGIFKVNRNETDLVIVCKNDHGDLGKIASILAKHLVFEYEEKILLEFISSTFCFQDYDEQVQILALAKSIIHGDLPNLPGLKRISSRNRILFQAFYEYFLSERCLPFESFIRFRLKPYRECLLRYTELAIDEYKLEQEYQSFVETLRRLLKKRRPMIEKIKVEFHKSFRLFDQQGHQIFEDHFKKQLDPFLNANEQLYATPSTLMTLIGIAPNKIDLYTDKMDIGMIQTIQNVFQERVNIMSFHQNQMNS